MDNFKRVFKIGTVAPWEGKRVSYFVAAEYVGGQLSLQGVEGPTLSGDCIGSCGQARDGLTDKSLSPGDGWTRALAARLAAIWDDWHLNHMNAADSAMRRDGWREQAARPVRGYKFSLESAVTARQRAIKESSLARLASGESVQLTEGERTCSALPYSYTQWVLADEPEPAARPFYERSRSIHNGGVEPAEHKTLGWLKPAEHPLGLLGKIHPESGNGYGSAWYKEEVPESVLAELVAMPACDRPLQWFDWLGADIESAIVAAHGGLASKGERMNAARAWREGLAGHGGDYPAGSPSMAIYQAAAAKAAKESADAS